MKIAKTHKNAKCKNCVWFYGGFCTKKPACRVATDYSCREYKIKAETWADGSVCKD